MRTFKHLSYNDRLKIEVLHNKHKCTGQVIADTLGFNNSTIYRELKRGMCDNYDTHLMPIRVYSADVAQKVHDEKAANKGAPLKIGYDYEYAHFLEKTIVDKKYSPAAALALARKEGFKTSVSKTTLYRYIDSNLFLRLSNKHLPYGKRCKKKYNKIRRISFRHPLCLSIENRHENILTRQDFGHWEMDTVVGTRNGKSTSLLVLTERKTRYEIIIKIQQRTSKEVTKAINRLHSRYKAYFKHIFKTITVDNGVEFSDAEGIQKQGRTQLYYCHPYSSFERGSNENANKLIRRFIPKGTDISKYTHKQIETLQHWINHYPRQIHGWKNSAELFEAELQYIAKETA